MEGSTTVLNNFSAEPLNNPINFDLTSSKLGKLARLFISSTESDLDGNPPPIIVIFSLSFACQLVLG